MKKIKISLFIGALLVSVFSEAVVLENVKVIRLYTQSVNGESQSEAHAISIDKSLDSSCIGRLHIDPLDKELFSTMLAYKISNTSFDLMYTTEMPNRTVRGHLVSSCKLFSVY